jgi:lysophospholipase L1-like esterase
MRLLCQLLLIASLICGVGCQSSQSVESKAPNTGSAGAAPISKTVTADPKRFEKEIVALEAKQAANPAKPGGVLFTGSSTIRRWNTDKWFPGMHAVNHGFGGSQTSDVNYYFDRIVTPLKPKVIVFYCGGNDLNAGKPPEEVFGDFQKFMAQVNTKLPATKVFYMSNNPSPKRWAQWPKQQAVNQMVKDWIASDKAGRVVYVDTATPMLGADGQPRPELYVEDKLHPNDAAYDIFANLLKPSLVKAMGQ